MKKTIKLLYLFWASMISIHSYAQGPTFVSISTTDADCGASLGSITLTPTGSGTYSYLWDNGSTEASIINMSMGDYTCTVTKDGSTEVIQASIYRPWDIERFEVGDPTLSIVGNSVTVNPSIPYTTTQLADQRTHCYDKTPIDIETQTGSIFAKFAKTHPNFPNQIANPDTTAPPVFYVALFESKDLSNHARLPVFVLNANLRVATGGHTPATIKFDTGVEDIASSTYTGFDYTDDDEFEIRFLGNHQVQAYLEGVLIGSGTLPQRTTNEYVAVIGFNDRVNLDRRIAYDLKTSFCASMPIIKTTINHNNKFGASGSIALAPLDVNYIDNTYSYQWSTGSTNNNISNLQKGNYSVTMTNATGENKIQTYEILDKLSLEKADPENSILKIVDNQVTCDPALPMQTIYDYRSHAYDSTLVINAEQGGGSVKFRVSSKHPAFPNQHSNDDVYNKYNSIFYIRLQEAVSPLPVPSFYLDHPFQIVFSSDGQVFTSSRETTSNPSSRQYIPNFSYYNGGFNIELRFTGNKEVEIYMNDILVATRTLVEPIDDYHLMIGFNDNPVFQRRIAYNMITSFESKVPLSYAQVSLEKNQGYFKLTDDNLKFRFLQEYGVGVGGEIINYKIYPWNRQTPVSGNMTLEEGHNNLDLDVSNLTSDSYYTLEFEANKKQKYVLKFKTKP